MTRCPLSLKACSLAGIDTERAERYLGSVAVVVGGERVTDPGTPNVESLTINDDTHVRLYVHTLRMNTTRRTQRTPNRRTALRSAWRGWGHLAQTGDP